MMARNEIADTIHAVVADLEQLGCSQIEINAWLNGVTDVPTLLAWKEIIGEM